MSNEGKLIQKAQIKKSYDMLKEERIVTQKDVAFNWIINIGEGYDGAMGIGELRAVIDEMIAYAILGKECAE